MLIAQVCVDSNSKYMLPITISLSLSEALFERFFASLKIHHGLAGLAALAAQQAAEAGEEGGAPGCEVHDAVVALGRRNELLLGRLQ